MLYALLFCKIATCHRTMLIYTSTHPNNLLKLTIMLNVMYKIRLWLLIIFSVSCFGWIYPLQKGLWAWVTVAKVIMSACGVGVDIFTKDSQLALMWKSTPQWVPFHVPLMSHYSAFWLNDNVMLFWDIYTSYYQHLIHVHKIEEVILD